MHILVTGANGFVGQALCKKLVQQGVGVTAVVRKADADLPNVTTVVKSLSAKTEWQDTLKNIDVIIHLAGRAHIMNEAAEDPYQAYAEVNIEATRHLAEQAVLSGVRRFVFVSTVKVNGESTGPSAFNESKNAQPEDDYAKTKYEAEKALNQIAKEEKLEVVIVRPPLIYGENVKANFKNLIKLSQSGLPMPFGAIKNKRSLLYLENLIDFLLLCAKHPKAVNETFLISDDDDVSTTQLIQTIAVASNKKAILVPVPMEWLKLLLKLIGKQSLSVRLFGNLQVDTTKAKTLLNWAPMFSFKEGISKTIKGSKS